MKFLNLGCGNKYHKDWVNIDFVSNSEYVLQHNLLTGIPLEDNEVDVVYHSHVLEHFSKEDGFHFIEECFRVLNLNGILRIAVPDLESIAKEYLQNLQMAIEGDEKAKSNYEWIKLELFDQMVRNESGGEMKKYLHQSIIPNQNYVFERIGSEGKTLRESFFNSQNQNLNNLENSKMNSFKPRLVLKRVKKAIVKLVTRDNKSTLTAQQHKALKIGQFRLGGEIHQWMYDRYSLSEALKKAGFSDVKVCNAFESEILHWEKYQLDVVNGEIRKPDSLFIEAKKL